MLKIKIENTYEDGHESERVVEVEAPNLDDYRTGVYEAGDVAWVKDAIDEWFDTDVYEFTGDGHGIDGMGSCYTATVIESDSEQVPVGANYEWVS